MSFSSHVTENATNSLGLSHMIPGVPVLVSVPSQSETAEDITVARPDCQRMPSSAENRVDSFGADVLVPPLKMPSSSSSSGTSFHTACSDYLPGSDCTPPRMARGNTRDEIKKGNAALWRRIYIPPRLARCNARVRAKLCAERPISSGRICMPPRMVRQNAHVGINMSNSDFDASDSDHMLPLPRAARRNAQGGSNASETSSSSLEHASDNEIHPSGFANHALEVENLAHSGKGSNVRTLPRPRQNVNYPRVGSKAPVIPMPSALVAGTTTMPMLSTLANGVLVNRIPHGGSADGKALTVAVALPGKRDNRSESSDKKLGTSGSGGRKDALNGLSDVDIPNTPFDPFGNTEELEHSDRLRDDIPNAAPIGNRILEKNAVGDDAGEADMEEGNDADDETTATAYNIAKRNRDRSNRIKYLAPPVDPSWKAKLRSDGIADIASTRTSLPPLKSSQHHSFVHSGVHASTRASRRAASEYGASHPPQVNLDVRSPLILARTTGDPQADGKKDVRLAESARPVQHVRPHAPPVQVRVNPAPVEAARTRQPEGHASSAEQAAEDGAKGDGSNGYPPPPKERFRRTMMKGLHKLR